MELELLLHPESLAVCRLAAASPLPAWVDTRGFCSVSWTEEETSIVCAEEDVPADVEAERGWRAIQVVGLLDFGLTGVFLSIAAPLAQAGIPIFTVSTYATDYVLVRATALERASQALAGAGHTLR
jgi:hypothetical protein